jgi:hypothetical protein
MAIPTIPVDDTTWDTTTTVQNGETANEVNLNRAVTTLRSEFQDVRELLWGDVNATSSLETVNTIDGGDVTGTGDDFSDDV